MSQINIQSVSEITRGEELLPCPFCGGDAEQVSPNDTRWGRCTSCHIGWTIRDQWNTRAINSATAAKDGEVKMERRHFTESLESDSIVGSCQCDIKTPEIQHHKPGCKYRLISERDVTRHNLELLQERMAEVTQENQALQARVRELQEVIESAKSAFGEHPDTDMDLAERISQLRDENREWFHKYTNGLDSVRSEEERRNNEEIANLMGGLKTP